MEYIILDIARILRKSGIYVGTGEIADCINALKLLDTGKVDKYRFYNLLNAAMVKTEWGTGYIQWLVELFFEPDSEVTADRGQVLSMQVFSAMETGLGRAGKGAPVNLLVEAVLKKNVELIYALVKGYDLSLDSLLENREEALAKFKLETGWLEVSEAVENYYAQGHISTEEYESALEVLEEWNTLIMEEIERLQAKTMSREYLTQIMRTHNPRCINFLEADDFQISQMAREVQKLAKKLAVRKGRRRKAGTKGEINLSRSIKRAVQTGGIPFRLVKMDRKPSKPDIWLLCDMSNSVRKFSYFMLLFVYTVQKHYSNIKSFIFVDNLLEVTDYFKEQDLDSALDNLGSLKGYNLTGFSHYGNVLHQFKAHDLALLNKNTTVLILGDAKNNWNKTDGSEVLEKISESAAALYWLNPMAVDLWSQKDCLMEKYRKSCTGVYQCSNIEQLEQFIYHIL
ncbi:MAG: VWA domain-containing protein [Clostridiales bacterium]|nr:VWA domain-containing protein [Eubacteriales bacterium]MDH7566037.1 VWA domain-containing protein [Clostridiales bacterium]